MKLQDEFVERYCNFEVSERISVPDMQNILNFWMGTYHELVRQLNEMKEERPRNEIHPDWERLCEDVELRNKTVDEIIIKIQEFAGL